MLRAQALFPALFATVLGWGHPRARACDCSRLTVEEAFKLADRVLLARAGRSEAVGEEIIQSFEILDVLKGPSGVPFERRRPSGVISGCDASYSEREVALLFAHAGELSICDLNLPLDHLLWDLPAILNAAGPPSPTPPAKRPSPKPPKQALLDRPGLELALSTALEGYLHDRKVLHVGWAGLAKQKGKAGATSLVFTAAEEEPIVWIDAGLRRGPWRFVRGFFPAEGLAFAVLVGEQGKALTPIAHARVERADADAAYRCAGDGDCQLTCAQGGLNRRWLEAHQDQLERCKDGCEGPPITGVQCLEGVCTAMQRTGPALGCTRQPISSQK